MGDPADGGTLTPVQSADMEIEKDKGKRPISYSQLGKAGEGTSRTVKEVLAKKGNRRMGQFLPKLKTIPKLQIKSTRIREDISYMKERSLIGKFIGIWPSEKTLTWWINTTWKPQGHYDLQLGAKGFFIVIFFNEDRTRIFESGPYLYNSAGLFLRPWKERFNADNENLTIALF